MVEHAEVAAAAESLALTAEVWTAIKAAGACACCAARLAGCREGAVFECDERDLRVCLDTRFSQADKPDSTSANNSSTRSGSAGDDPTATSKSCCTLCLGLLQHEVPVRMTPRARPSSDSHGDDLRACVAREEASQANACPAAQGASSPQALSSSASATPVVVVAATCLRETDAELAVATETSGNSTAAAASAGAAVHTTGSSSAAVAVATSEERSALPRVGASASAAAPDYGVASGEAASSAPDRPTGSALGYRRVPVAAAIADCTASRGYTVTSFAITAAVPACLAVRDAAFLETHGGLLSQGAGSSPTTVSVKEALKIGLAGALRTLLGGAELDADSDFAVEVTAKAPEADAHAMTMLLGGPALSQPGAKPPGWPGAGRWAKKRQRREEHRNPGLTVGAVKKGLATLGHDGRRRLRCWVEGLAAGGDTRDGKRCEAGEAREDGGVTEARGEARGAGIEGGGTTGAMDVEEGDDAGSSNGAKVGSDAGTVGNNNSVGAAKAAPAEPAAKPAPNGKGSGNSSRAPSSSNCGVSAATMEAHCEVAIHRLSIHFWGRYTKLSRTVPQTPWIKGFFSVQEAVSEPFKAFSGCVEGLLHGAGREDVDVRMLGRGRPFSLELVDSLRTADQIAARLTALADEVNSGTGRRNAGGGVAVSELRPAGPGDLPSDVQKVGEGKRKHYRCVVWVSRAVTREELEAVCDRGELMVQQGTPIRVLHRRTLMDRPRSIFDMRAGWINEHFFVLDLTTSAGEITGHVISCHVSCFVLCSVVTLLVGVLWS